MDEIDDAPVFGEEGPQSIKEGNGRRMDGIKPEEPRFLNRKRREVSPEALKDLPDFVVCSGAMANQAMRDEFFNVRAAQCNPDRIAVLDLVESILIDLSRLFDPLLKGSNDPEGKRRSFLSQVLKKANVFVIGVGIGLGAKKLG
jgi:hypothetical protein